MFREDFKNNYISNELNWFNEPEQWKIENNKLIIFPEKTDFWQKTHYGFEYDNGHFLFYKTENDKNFVLSSHVHFFPKHQYDQAGLMVRLTKDFWIKTSVEYENEELSRLGSVVTNFGYSDWSTQDFSSKTNELTFRIVKDGNDYLIEFKEINSDWSQLRIAHLFSDEKYIQCGIYACSPTKPGYKAEFDYIKMVQC